MYPSCSAQGCSKLGILTVVFQLKHQVTKSFFCEDHTQDGYDILKTVSLAPGTSLIVRRVNDGDKGES